MAPGDKQGKDVSKMEAQHNATQYYASKVDFIAAELRRLQCALEGRINAETGEIDCNVDAVTEIPVVRLAVDLRLQLGPFDQGEFEEAAPCALPGTGTSTTTRNGVSSTRYFPPLPLDFFIGGIVLDNNVHVYMVDPDAFAGEEEFSAVGAKGAKKKAKKTEADGGATVAPQIIGCAAPIEIPSTHPFLAKAQIEFIDNALIVNEIGGKGPNCEPCPNVYKSHPPFKHMTQPVLLRSIPSATTPLPSPFEWSDLPGVGNDELLCYCQGERLIIEEMTENYGPENNGGFQWSNFCGDADGIPSGVPGTSLDPRFAGLHAVVTAECIIYARADSLIDTFCCPDPFTPVDESCIDVDLKQRAPFMAPKVVFSTDGGQDMADVMRAAEKALADPGRPIGQAPTARVKRPIAVGGGTPMRRRIVPRRIA
jgi:hypothetical protein